MVVRKFSPKGSYLNGIIKYVFPTNKSDQIDLKVTDVGLKWSQIYPTAFLDDQDTYFQSRSKQTFLNMTFKRYFFLTHFAAAAREYADVAWCNPKNFEVTACNHDSCTVIDSITNSERYNTTKMVLTPINPGVYNYLQIKMITSACTVTVLRRFEIFGYLCDSLSECKWKNIFRVNTCKHSKRSISSIFFVMLCIVK